MAQQEPATILVVDDDQLVRDLVASLLHVEGYRVIEAADGELALAQMQALSPDLVLLDVMMPGRLDGVQICRQLKSSEATMLIPVVILTVSSNEEDIMATYNHHANCYITKPVDFNQFIKVVESIEEFWFTIVKLLPNGAKE